MADWVDVVVGVLVEQRDDAARILIARRPSDKVLGDCWELPGGKVEPDESMRDGLAREFAEELGLTVRVGKALPIIEHTYDHAHVRLHPFYCTRVAGEPRNLDVVEHRWVTPAELRDYAFPPANEALMQNLIRELQVL